MEIRGRNAVNQVPNRRDHTVNVLRPLQHARMTSVVITVSHVFP
jgi:hypothetical protein